MAKTILVLTVIFLGFVCSDTLAQCSGDVPYAIKVRSGAIAVNANWSAKSDEIAKTTNMGIGVGFERTLYSAMAQQAIDEILKYYECQIADHIMKNTPLSAQDKKKAISQVKIAVSALKRASGQYFSAFASNDRNSINEYSDVLSQTLRTDKDPKIDLAFIDESIGKIDEKTFLQKIELGGWIQTAIRDKTITACGGVVLAALGDNAAYIQHTVASMKEILRNYLDASDEYNKQVALSDLYTQASTAAMPQQIDKKKYADVINKCATEQK